MHNSGTSQNNENTLQPYFSIIIPVKNGGAYLHDCIKSILDQSYKKFNLIILDSQSVDGSSEYLIDIASKDDRVKYFNSNGELTIEGNWQRIINQNKNEYMTIIGQDDLFEIDFLKEIVNLINQTPNAALYATHFKIIDSESNLIRICKPIPTLEEQDSFLASRLAGIRDSFATGYVIKSSDYDSIGGIPMYPNLLYADDALWLKLMSKGIKATSKKISFSYRLHIKSTSGKPDKQKLFYALVDYLHYLESLGKSSKEIQYVLALYASQYVAERCHEYYVTLVNSSPNYENEMAKIRSLMSQHSKLELINQWQPTQKRLRLDVKIKSCIKVIWRRVFNIV